MTLQFFEKAHRYRLDGKAVPGVTGLLDKGLAKPAIPRWAAGTVAQWVIDNPDGLETLRAMGREPAVAALKQIPWQKRDEAAVRGTDVHALAEQVINGQSVEVLPHLAGYVEGYARLVDELGIEPIVTEARGANRKWWYAGTLDLIGTIDGETLLLDIKTSRAIYGSVACQVAAYANFEFILDDAGEEVPLPHIDGIGALHVTEEGSRFHRFPDMGKAWTTFQHIQWVAKQIPDIDEWGMSA